LCGSVVRSPMCLICCTIFFVAEVKWIPADVSIFLDFFENDPFILFEKRYSQRNMCGVL